MWDVTMPRISPVLSVDKNQIKSETWKGAQPSHTLRAQRALVSAGPVGSDSLAVCAGASAATVVKSF